jgi:hypothetical protein
MGSRSLSALLSQILVAFTVELDNEFERRMGEAGYFGARLSLVVWANLMRFAGEGAVSVRDLAAQALAPGNRMKFELGCLERWGFVVLRPDSGSEHRAGWGSGRGIRAEWMVRLTPKGLTASRIWPPLFGEIEQRWERRFGQSEIGRLRRTLQGVAETPASSAAKRVFLCPRCFPRCCWRSGWSSMASRRRPWYTVPTRCGCWGRRRYAWRRFRA